MSNKRKKDLDDLLQDPELNLEIRTDEEAVHKSGLNSDNILELENILAEDWDSVPDHEEAPLTPEEALHQFLYEEEAEEVEEVESAEFDASTQVLPDPFEESEIPAEDPEDTFTVDIPEYVTEEPTQVISMEPEETYVEEEAACPEDGEEYPEEYPAEEYEEADAEEAPVSSKRNNPNHKGRPKWKKGYGLLGIPHIIATAIWLAITLVIGISLGRILWVCCADVMAFGKPQVTAFVEVTEDDSIETVSQKLADANLIRYPGLFQTFAEITKKDDRIQPGVHELGSHLDYNAMINNMVYTGSARQEVEITFPEGYNCAQTFRLLEEKNICSVEDLEEWAANGELKDYWFLEGVERGDKYCLEGYLAPDTYRFYTGDEPRNVLEKFLNEFDDRFTDIMKDDFQTMQERYARMRANRGMEPKELTLHQVVTIASIVERETANDAESYQIASVFYNRVTTPSILTLGSDATVYYALGDYYREMGKLTEADIATDSPYNTRKVPGFPPGPICNPGAYSLYAALDPDDTNYLYFIYDAANSQHLFSSSYDEHLRKAAELGE